jgi:hypothetical protein
MIFEAFMLSTMSESVSIDDKRLLGDLFLTCPPGQINHNYLKSASN